MQLALLMWTGSAAAAPSRCSLTGRGNCYPLRSRPCCDSDAVCYTKTPGEAWAQCRTDQCSAVCGWECRALAVNGSVDGGTFRSGSQSGEEALAASAGRSADATKTSPQQMPSSAVGRAVEQVLCRGQPSFSSVATNPGHNGVSGLTSQLNYVTQDVLDHLYRSEGLSAADSIHRTATLQGYGGGKFGEHFEPPACPKCPIGGQPQIMAEAVKLLLKSRYLVVSHLVHQLYQPRRTQMTFHTARATRYDLAMHVRRGEKAHTVIRRGETHMRPWTEDELARTALQLLANTTHAHRAFPRTWRILLASDDEGFAQRLTQRLELSQNVQVLRLSSDSHDASSRSSASEAGAVCDSSCLRTPLELAAHFALSDRLMLSSMSNMGVYMLAWWAAANNDSIPILFDLDGRVTEQKLRNGQFFCSLAWGAKHGLCSASQSACSLPWNLHREFCLNASQKSRRRIDGSLSSASHAG